MATNQCTAAFAVPSEDMRKLLFLFAAVAFAQHPWPPAGLRCPERTLVVLKTDPAKAAKAGGFFDEHLAYVRSLMKSGKVVFAGPLQDGGGAMVFAITEWNEVEEILKKEPFNREGIMTVATHAVWQACEPAP